jgi:hypothetical protein
MIRLLQVAVSRKAHKDKRAENAAKGLFAKDFVRATLLPNVSTPSKIKATLSISRYAG